MPHDMAVLPPKEATPIAFCDRDAGGAGGRGGARFLQSDSRLDQCFSVGGLGVLLVSGLADVGAGSASVEASRRQTKMYSVVVVACFLVLISSKKLSHGIANGKFQERSWGRSCECRQHDSARQEKRSNHRHHQHKLKNLHQICRKSRASSRGGSRAGKGGGASNVLKGTFALFRGEKNHQVSILTWKNAFLPGNDGWNGNYSCEGVRFPRLRLLPRLGNQIYDKKNRKSLKELRLKMVMSPKTDIDSQVWAFFPHCRRL
jgi:hypothetical protein